ncbi:MAG: phage tail tape measure protein [Methylophaga sp.]|nr:phage tail tape measure protein [Methylophaga sp.]
MSELETRIVVDLVGNLEKQLKRNTQAISKFSRNGGRDLDRMDKKTRRLSGGFGKLAGRLTGAAVAYKAFNAASKVVDFDANVTQLQTSGNYSDSEIASLKNKIIEVANQRDVRLSPGAILAAVQKVITLTGDKEFAEANIRNIALTARATNSDLGKVADVASSLYLQNIRKSEDVFKALDGLVVISEAGAVSFDDLATVGPKLFASMAGLGLAGEALTADLAALAQIAKRAKGTPAEAVTAIEAFAAELLTDEVQQKIGRKGISVRDKSGAFKLPSQLALEINQAANGNAELLGKVFSKEALVVFKGLNSEGSTELLPVLSKIRGDGNEILKDALKNASTAKASFQAISNKGAAAADAIFSNPTKDLANAFNSASGVSAFDNLNMATVAIADSVTGYSAFKHYFDKALTSIFSTQPLSLEEYGGQSQKSKIELEIKSDAAVKVKSITSQNLDIEVDTGLTMGAN